MCQRDFKYAIRNKLIKENPRNEAVIPKKPVTIEELEKAVLKKRILKAMS